MSYAQAGDSAVFNRQIDKKTITLQAENFK